MSFIGSALGVTNGYVAQNGGGDYATQIQNQDNNNLKATYANQTTLAQQLQAQANGQGPNIAQQQLQQATDANSQKAAGMIASQRGMNTGLAARNIAQNAAATNQNAAGQSATLRAQEQLSAQGAEANVYGQQAGENQAAENSLTAAQTAANTTNAQTAASNQGLFGSIFAHGGEVTSLPKHLQILNAAKTSKVHPLHLAQGGGLIGSNFSGSLMGLIKGLWANGVSATPAATPTAQQTTSAQNAQMGAGPSEVDANGNLTSAGTQDQISQQNASMMGGHSTMDSAGMTDAPETESSVDMAGADAGAADAATTSAAADAATTAATAEGGDSLLELAAAHGAQIPGNDKKVPAMISPGERYIPPHLVEAVRKGKLAASKAAPKVPGKAKVAGDNLKNDVVPANLSPGGVVIPRSKADNDTDAREFLKAIQAKKEKSGAPTGYTRVLTAKRNSA